MTDSNPRDYARLALLERDAEPKALLRSALAHRELTVRVKGWTQLLGTHCIPLLLAISGTPNMAYCPIKEHRAVEATAAKRDDSMLNLIISFS